MCEQPVESNVFWVSHKIDVARMSENDVREIIKRIIDNICGERKKSLEILENEVFDPIFSILFHLENVSMTVRKELLETLTQGLKNLTDLMEGTKVIEWASQNFLSKSTIAQLVREEPQCKLAIRV